MSWAAIIPAALGLIQGLSQNDASQTNALAAAGKPQGQGNQPYDPTAKGFSQLTPSQKDSPYQQPNMLPPVASDALQPLPQANRSFSDVYKSATGAPDSQNDTGAATTPKAPDSQSGQMGLASDVQNLKDQNRQIDGIKNSLQKQNDTVSQVGGYTQSLASLLNAAKTPSPQGTVGQAPPAASYVPTAQLSLNQLMQRFGKGTGQNQGSFGGSYI